MKIINGLIIIFVILLVNPIGQITESSDENNDLDVIHRQNWAYYAQEPLIELKTARSAFDHEDYESAAYSLRQVNAYLMLEVLRLEQGQEILSPIINDLNNLVDRLEKKKDVSQEDYDMVLGKVNLTLSTHYHELAKKVWENNRPVRAGQALQASTLYLERAENISSNSLSDKNASIVNESKEISEELINGNVEIQDESVKPKMKAFGGALKDFKNKSADEFRMERSF